MEKVKNRKEFFSSDYRKNGYLLVGRGELKGLFADDVDLRELSRVLLCVQTYAYFTEGQVCMNDGVYVCRPGEWLTTYSAIAGYTGLDRRLVKTRLKQLEQYKVLQVVDVSVHKKIILQDYTHQTAVNHSFPTPVPNPVAASDCIPSAGLIAGAAAYYSNLAQEGGVN